MNKLKTILTKLKNMWNKPPDGRFLTLKEMGSFGLYAMGNSFIQCAINYVVTITYIPYFYNIDALHAYIILLVGNGLNLILQPILGNIMEKTSTKWGRYKPFILFSLPFLAILSVMAAWVPQFGAEKARIIYAYLTCTPLIAISTFAKNMYSTMPNVITTNGQERADIMTPVELLVGFAPSIVQIIAGPIRAFFLKSGNEYMAIRIIGIVSVVLGIVCVMFLLKVKERVYKLEDRKKEEQTSFSDVKMLLKNKPLFILFFALIIGSLREFWRIFMPFMIQFRFAESVETALNVSGLPLTIIGFASTVSMLLFPIVTRKMNKNMIIIVFSALNVICMAVLGFIGFERIPIGTTSAVVLTLLFFIAAINPTYLALPVMMGEIADYQQFKTGKRLEGYLQNLIFSAPILVSNVFMLFSWIIQNKIGFEPKVYANSNVLSVEQQAISNSWFNIVCLISAASSLLMMAVLAFYPLSKRKASEISVALTEMAINKEEIINK